MPADNTQSAHFPSAACTFQLIPAQSGRLGLRVHRFWSLVPAGRPHFVSFSPHFHFPFFRFMLGKMFTFTSLPNPSVGKVPEQENQAQLVVCGLSRMVWIFRGDGHGPLRRASHRASLWDGPLTPHTSGFWGRGNGPLGRRKTGPPSSLLRQ